MNAKKKIATEVTLVIVDCVDVDLALKALAVSLCGFQPAEAKLLSHQRPANCVADVTFVPIRQIESVRAYNEFMLFDLYKYVNTPFCLSVHADGFVINPQAWNDIFLRYDYVGAPWPATAWNSRGSRVGNSGFCLRSRRLLKNTASLPSKYITDHRKSRKTTVDDIFTCCDAYPLLSRTMSYAPMHVAWVFSREQPMLPGEPRQSLNLAGAFGFHGRMTPATARACDRLKNASLDECVRGLVNFCG